MISKSKAEAVPYLIEEIERIEKERIAEHFSIDATKFKKEATDSILKVINNLEINNEN